jgi:branched-chain amino acid transport system ATP-binding protein
LFYKLTVAENLRLRCHRDSTVEVEEVLSYFPALGKLTGRRAGLLSGGEQQMLALAGALVADPKVIMLDEMSLGLAPIIVEQLLPIVRNIADERGMAVLLVEQHVLAALNVADRGYVLAHGNVVAEGTAAELKRDVELLEASYLGETSTDHLPIADGI